VASLRVQQGGRRGTAERARAGVGHGQGGYFVCADHGVAADIIFSAQMIRVQRSHIESGAMPRLTRVTRLARDARKRDVADTDSSATFYRDVQPRRLARLVQRKT